MPKAVLGAVGGAMSGARLRDRGLAEPEGVVRALLLRLEVVEHPFPLLRRRFDLLALGR